MHTLLHLAILTVTVLGIARYVPEVRIKGVGSAIIVAVVFSVLNVALGWLLRALLFVPALLTLGLLFLFIPFIVNTVMLWLTDKLIDSFEIRTVRALLTSAAVLTIVNWLVHLASNSHRLVRTG
jgi:putative membrane protein